MFYRSLEIRHVQFIYFIRHEWNMRTGIYSRSISICLKIIIEILNIIRVKIAKIFKKKKKKIRKPLRTAKIFIAGSSWRTSGAWLSNCIQRFPYPISGGPVIANVQFIISVIPSPAANQVRVVPQHLRVMTSACIKSILMKINQIINQSYLL